jgi:hypothetical protein
MSLSSCLSPPFGATAHNLRDVDVDIPLEVRAARVATEPRTTVREIRHLLANLIWTHTPDAITIFGWSHQR